MRGRRQCDDLNGCGKFYSYLLLHCPHCGIPETFSTLIPFNPRDWVYDLETLPNLFTASLKHPNTGNREFFEISERRNDLSDLVWFLNALRETCCRMIGYNNIGFDYPIIHFIMQNYNNGIGIDQIYQKSQNIIDTPWDNRWDNVVRDYDVLIEQIDLLKLHHFDNEARRTSLKVLEFNMRSQSIEDLPFEPGVPIAADQIPVVAKYNDHDVDETEKFYIESLEMLAFREEMGVKYGKNFLNHSDKKIGTELFVIELEKNNPGSCYMHIDGRKVVRQTIRNTINLNDIIFPYINFKQTAFAQVKQWLSSQTIAETKGVFESIEVSPEMAVNMNPKFIKVYGLIHADVPHLKESLLKKPVLLNKCGDDFLRRTDLHRFKFVSGWDKQSGLNCVIDGFQYDFGTGGIHGSIDSALVSSDDDYVIYDWDVAGYYPSLGAVNNLFPEHLSNQFGVVDAMLKEERSKHAKGTPLNTAIKLARNGAYCDSNNKHSSCYDPQYTMSITINGQLLICLLAEHLITIPGLTMIQVNTDGLTVRCPRGYVDRMKVICKWWEGFTCLELESAIYSRMFIRDVNNYIAEYEGGKLKRKGAYEYNLGWHQNHSELVIPMAVEAALIRDCDVEDFIRNHDDIFDFMLRTKLNRSDNLVIKDDDGDETPLQNTTRYYVAKEGGFLTKISPPAKGKIVGQWKRATKLTDHFYESVLEELGNGNHVDDLDVLGLPWDERINTKNKSKYIIRRTGLKLGQIVAPCNDIRDAVYSNIDFDYYIAEANKLINVILY